MPEGITCEICGRPVLRIKYYLFEGVQMILCEFCARQLGAQEVSSSKQRSIKKTIIERRNQNLLTKKRTLSPPEELQYEFVPNYGQKISMARRKLGLSLEDLARRLNVSPSYLLKIEKEKLKPDVHLGRRIERILDIKILRKIDIRLLEKAVGKSGDKITPVTLGDILVIEYKNKKKKNDFGETT